MEKAFGALRRLASGRSHLALPFSFVPGLRVAAGLEESGDLPPESLAG